MTGKEEALEEAIRRIERAQYKEDILGEDLRAVCSAARCSQWKKPTPSLSPGYGELVRRLESWHEHSRCDVSIASEALAALATLSARVEELEGARKDVDQAFHEAAHLFKDIFATWKTLSPTAAEKLAKECDRVLELIDRARSALSTAGGGRGPAISRDDVIEECAKAVIFFMPLTKDGEYVRQPTPAEMAERIRALKSPPRRPQHRRDHGDKIAVSREALSAARMALRRLNEDDYYETNGAAEREIMEALDGKKD